jgi:predicted RNA-binding protein associated with RNAse of E/G family
MPMVIGEREWTTNDLLLDIWISPDGRVTVRNETAFEAAVADGSLSIDEASWAEEHVRRLTAAIAQRRFPPPLVRNWQVDLRRIQEALAT